MIRDRRLPGCTERAGLLGGLHGAGLAHPPSAAALARFGLPEQDPAHRVEELRAIPSPVTAETRCTFTGFLRRPRSFASFSPPARASGTSTFVTAMICGFFASSGE